MKSYGLFILFVLFFIVFSSCAKSSGNAKDENYSGLIRYDIRNNELLPISILLPESYEVKLAGEMPVSLHMWATNVIRYEGRQIGGIFAGTFMPDIMLFTVNDEEIEFIELNILGSIYYIRLFENSNQNHIVEIFSYAHRFIFELWIEKYSEEFGKIYFHIWGTTDSEEQKDNLLMAFSTIQKIE